MSLPSDIFGLIYTYAYLPNPASWISIDRLMDWSITQLATNPVAIPWIRSLNDRFFIRIVNKKIINHTHSMKLQLAKNHSVEAINYLKSSGNINLMFDIDFTNPLEKHPYGYVQSLPVNYKALSYEYKKLDYRTKLQNLILTYYQLNNSQFLN